MRGLDGAKQLLLLAYWEDRCEFETWCAKGLSKMQNYLQGRVVSPASEPLVHDVSCRSGVCSSASFSTNSPHNNGSVKAVTHRFENSATANRLSEISPGQHFYFIGFLVVES